MNTHRSGQKPTSKLFFALFLLLLSIHGQPCFSQATDRAMGRLVELMDSLAKGEPSQLVYIQTSKGVYEPMEDLWFKAYVMDARTFAPSRQCQTLYLEMVNEATRQVVWKEKYEITGGFVDGHVYVHDTLSAGDYLLAAYTGLSFYGDSPEMKAVRRVQVRDKLLPNYDGWAEPAKTAAPKNGGATQFNTFPEGGNLVAGIQSRLAFKAVDPDGTPVDVRGTLFEGPDTLTTFTSKHDGMGSLVFTPEANKEYTICLSEPSTDSIYKLPDIYSEGISLQLVSRDKDYLEFNVSQSPSLGRRTVYLVGQIRGAVCCVAKGELSGELTMKIPLEEFPFQGIAEFTLYGGDLLPIAERLVYVHPEKRLYVTAELDKGRYQTREKATLKISVKDGNGEPATANLGVTVYDRLHQNQSDPINIFTYCYLTSQLRGRIYGPEYYFDEKNGDREAAMDLLMLTQGWRRYVWNASDPDPGDPDNRLVLSDGVDGELRAKQRLEGKASLEQFVKVYFPNNSGETYFVGADSAGRFSVAPEHLKAGQGSYVYLEPMGPKNLGLSISLADPFQTIDAAMEGKETDYPMPGPVRSTEEDMPLGQYVEGMRTLELAEVTVKARGTTVFRDKYIGHLDSLAKMESVIYVDKDGYLENYLEGYSHVIACTDPTIKNIPIEGETYRLVKYSEKGENGRIIVLDVYDIVFNYPTISEEQLMEMNNLSRTKAYYIHREFYQPVYDDTAPIDTFPDFRNTLLWDPLVTTDENGEATVEFYCSDLNTGFVGTIEGISGDGLLCEESFEFSVIKAKPVEGEK